MHSVSMRTSFATTPDNVGGQPAPATPRAPIQGSVLPKPAPPPPTARATALQALMTSPAWSEATVDQRRQLLLLLDRVGTSRVDVWSRAQGTTPYSNGYDALIRLFSLRAGDRPVLLERDREGQTIAERLSTLSIDPRVVSAVAPLSAEDIMANLLLELADPSRIDQANTGSCAPTSLQYQIVAYDPAEYTRICTGLLSTSASVRLRGGNTLTRDDNSITDSRVDPRSPTERLFQNALLQASVAPGQDYVADAYGEGVRADTSMFGSLPVWLKVICAFLFPIGIALACIPVRRRLEPGMNDFTMVNAATQLTGQVYEARSLDHSREQLDWLRERVPDGNFAGLGYFVGITPFGTGGHELLVERIDYSASPPVLVARNPWGASQLPAGAPLAPGLEDMVVEDQARGAIRIPLDRLSNFTLHYPR